MKLKRNSVWCHKGKDVTVLGPEDFDNYAYNLPSDKWELVKDENKTYWVGRKWLSKKESCVRQAKETKS